MSRVALFCSLIALFLTASWAGAQQPKTIPRLGFISPASSSTARPNLEALQQGLRDLGYIVGTNITLEARWAEGSPDRLSQLIAELARLEVDVMVVGSAAGALAAKKLQTKIPVVFAAVTDPLGYGIIDSLARPGGNITGSALGVGEGFSGKWVELLHETVPKAVKITVLSNSRHPLSKVFESETKAAARSLGITAVYFEAQDLERLTVALTRLEKQRAGGLVLTPDPLFSSQRNRIIEFLARIIHG